MLDDPLFSKLEINCWYETNKGYKADDNTLSLVATFEIAIPTGWTPKMLLGAIYLTSKEESNLVIVKEIKINDKIYVTFNNIAFLFKLTAKEVDDYHYSKSAYFRIRGGSCIPT